MSSKKILESLFIVNSGSNNADLSNIQAKRVILQDRGSGNLQVSSIEEISGSSNGSGVVIVKGQGKNNIINKGSGTILAMPFGSPKL